MNGVIVCLKNHHDVLNVINLLGILGGVLYITSPLLSCRTLRALSPATAVSWTGLTVSTWWPRSHTSILPVSSGEWRAGGYGMFKRGNGGTLDPSLVLLRAHIFNRCLAEDRTSASCCNSCWCSSLNSSSAFSTRCSITWERGTYCPLLPSDRCRRRRGGGVCGDAADVQREHV